MKEKIKQALKIILSSNDNELDIRNVKYLPRWSVLLIDTFLLICSIVLTVLILNDLNIKYLKLLNITQQVLLVIGVNFTFMILYKTYAGLIRHSSFMDAFKLLLASVSTVTVLFVINYSMLYVKGEKIYLNSSLILYLFISFTFLFLFRLAVKQLYEYFKVSQRTETYENAVIIGVDDAAISIAAALDMEHPQRFKIKGFASRNSSAKRLQILGKPIIKVGDKISDELKRLNANAVILSGNSLSAKVKFNIVEDCLENNIKVYNSPLVLDWSENVSVAKQVKNLQIEDLLEREPIVLHNKEKSKQLNGKVILVTGAAGSIGSEIVRQLANYNPELLLILDQAETPLHNLQLELRANFPDLNFKCIICDVANRNRLGTFFQKYPIEVVYHAAAYKHVPLMEDNCAEAVITNIYGTKNLADLAVLNKVSRFVMVSTDKAVNPSNVMGASKRAAEMYVQSRSFHKNSVGVLSKTKFITTRFGNVLGSNGSVVPLFKKQIEKGGPITITHPDIIRYFMTIPEACQLVLEAGAMGKGGEIYIFDMGEPVRIMDLAVKMIKLAGYIPNEEIDIKITGLRPGEKLYEELISDSSRALPTHHEKIMISKDYIEDFDLVSKGINKLIEAALKFDENKVVTRLKNLVPEFISKNSEFESLDTDEEIIEAPEKDLTVPVKNKAVEHHSK
ncbi:polysaccharide biosynthesis protein [Cochleicola gelatinilyticus]|uniref:Polysaccharide biosynthesis protein n=1 Tax=Cochleicola gelatinilyticus TaxID=1763537 RepID=A0A167G8A5_9FLAO|nr:nucleoside-diphosphate sugar epimerase/dehydratase [Cochleicola gelatinilyticus]OAB77323.1 polysaccharide biosynthesis protein [Cochleicola gelatinilyticus]